MAKSKLFVDNMNETCNSKIIGRPIASCGTLNNLKLAMIYKLVKNNTFFLCFVAKNCNCKTKNLLYCKFIDKMERITCICIIQKNLNASYQDTKS